MTSPLTINTTCCACARWGAAKAAMMHPAAIAIRAAWFLAPRLFEIKAHPAALRFEALKSAPVGPAGKTRIAGVPGEPIALSAIVFMGIPPTNPNCGERLRTSDSIPQHFSLLKRLRAIG